MDLKETGLEDVDWMHLAQDRDQWQALVNMVMKFQITKKLGNKRNIGGHFQELTIEVSLK
jgi:hypothetical protein